MSARISLDHVNESVEALFPGSEHTWDNFLGYLRKHPVVLPDHGGVAELVEEYDADYGDYSSWFVFKVAGWGGPKHFKRTTRENSFGGSEHGDTYEVQPAVVQQTIWETV